MGSSASQLPAAQLLLPTTAVILVVWGGQNVCWDVMQWQFRCPIFLAFLGLAQIGHAQVLLGPHLGSSSRLGPCLLGSRAGRCFARMIRAGQNQVLPLLAGVMTATAAPSYCGMYLSMLSIGIALKWQATGRSCPG